MIAKNIEENKRGLAIGNLSKNLENVEILKRKILLLEEQSLSQLNQFNQEKKSFQNQIEEILSEMKSNEVKQKKLQIQLAEKEEELIHSEKLLQYEKCNIMKKDEEINNLIQSIQEFQHNNSFHGEGIPSMATNFENHSFDRHSLNANDEWELKCNELVIENSKLKEEVNLLSCKRDKETIEKLLEENKSLKEVE